MQAKKTSLTLLYIVVYTVLLHAETLCKLVTCCPSSEWECRGLKNEEMVQGATKDRKGNPRNVQKRKSLAAGLAGNCGPEGDILQLIWKAYSNSKNILKKKKERQECEWIIWWKELLNTIGSQEDYWIKRSCNFQNQTLFTSFLSFSFQQNTPWSWHLANTFRLWKQTKTSRFLPLTCSEHYI